MEPVDFLKLHGLGNDFILIDERAEQRVPEAVKSQFAIRCCDRHRGVGADGVLFIGPHDDGVSFRIFNADGSESGMCINGIRCVSLAMRLRLDPEGPDEIDIATPVGIVRTKVLELNELEGTVEAATSIRPRYEGWKRITAGRRARAYHLVNVGNPHAVTFVNRDVSLIDVEGIGHALEHSDDFKPDGVNTEFVNRISSGHLRMRVHERGACETQACGSGAIAAAVAAREMEPSQSEWRVEMLGGALDVVLRKGTVVRGRAALSFEGRTHL